MSTTAKRAYKSAKLTPVQMARKIALLEAGVSVADVAREAGVSRQTAWSVGMDKTTSASVERAWAKLTGRAITDLFPRAEQVA